MSYIGHASKTIIQQKKKKKKDGDVKIYLSHASFEDFLRDKERSENYLVDFEEWVYSAFCDAFSLGCKLLGCSVDASVKSASRNMQGLSATSPVLTKIEGADVSISRL